MTSEVYAKIEEKNLRESQEIKKEFIKQKHHKQFEPRKLRNKIEKICRKTDIALMRQNKTDQKIRSSARYIKSNANNYSKRRGITEFE